MNICKRHGGAGAGHWLVVGLVAISLAGCKEDQKLSISGAPATSIGAGADYSFLPSAAADQRRISDSLTFTIENKPVWATFNAVTGELAGTPTSAHVGTFSNIVIGVADGTASASLPAFSIDVLQAANGSATLSWMPPTQNADGSALTNLAGYRIYYGTNPATLSQTVELKNPGLSRYLVENLSPATWHFAMKAFNSKSEDSALIGVVSITIR
jgi:hypothetical protein